MEEVSELTGIKISNENALNASIYTVVLLSQLQHFPILLINHVNVRLRISCFRAFGINLVWKKQKSISQLDLFTNDEIFPKKLIVHYHKSLHYIPQWLNWLNGVKLYFALISRDRQKYNWNSYLYLRSYIVISNIVILFPCTCQLPYACYSATQVVTPPAMSRAASMEGGGGSPYSSCTYQSIEGLTHNSGSVAPCQRMYQCGNCGIESSASSVTSNYARPRRCGHGTLVPRPVRRNRRYIPDYYGWVSPPQTPPYQSQLPMAPESTSASVYGGSVQSDPGGATQDTVGVAVENILLGSSNNSRQSVNSTYSICGGLVDNNEGSNLNELLEDCNLKKLPDKLIENISNLSGLKQGDNNNTPSVHDVTEQSDVDVTKQSDIDVKNDDPFSPPAICDKQTKL